MRHFVGLALCALLGGCGAGNQALLASGGTDDVVAMGHVTEEYGTAEPDEVVTVKVGDEVLPFRIWVHKTRPKIMAQTAAIAATAAAGFVRGMTLGIVSGDRDYQPFEDAAMSYLNEHRGPGCRLFGSHKITRIGFEWDYECPAPAPAPAPARDRRRQPLPR